jgi:hypothetical protein
MDDDRQASTAGGQVGRPGYIAAKSHLQAADGAQGGDVSRGLQLTQRVGEVHRGLDVSGRMAARDMAQLHDGKVEVGIWVRLVLQHIMPPLAIVWPKTAARHDGAKKLTVYRFD